MSYIEKNRGQITFHKLWFFKEFGPGAYRLRFIDEKIPDEDKEQFLVGRAIEDGLKLTEEDFLKEYEFVSRRSNGLKYGERNKNGKYELNKTQKNYALKCSQSFFENPFFQYDRKNSGKMIKVKYKNQIIAGEVDHLGKNIKVKVDDNNEKRYKFSIDDIKTCGDILSYFNIIKGEVFLNLENIYVKQYIAQQSFYQFLLQISKEANANDICSRLYFGSKEEYPQTMTVFISPQTLLEYRPIWISVLDELISFYESGFPEPTFADYLLLSVSGIPGNPKQNKLIVI